MDNMNGRLLQRTISRALPSKQLAYTAEILLLLVIGMITVTLHAKLRIPMSLPGKQGLIFMAMIVFTRYFTSIPFNSTITCLGASALLSFNILGFNDPFLPVTYLLMGLLIDAIFTLLDHFNIRNILVISLAAAVCWMSIPLFRLLIGAVTGFPFHSFRTGFVYPLTTYPLFGFLGGLLASSAYFLSFRNKRQ
jgi:hypothetical protein